MTDREERRHENKLTLYARTRREKIIRAWVWGLFVVGAVVIVLGHTAGWW